MTGPTIALDDATPERLARQVQAQVFRLLSTCPACAVRDARRESARQQIKGQLTARRLQVLTLCADGYSIDQIAARLHISEGTAKTHLMWLHEAFDVQSRTALVARALRAGVIE